MRRLALVPILITALVFPSAASALGLGDIELQSALNQRLDAEIPLRGVSADTSDDIIVTLASEEAFQDVGLRRPFSLTKLRFQVKQGSSGGYYVHVTSREPIVEPFLSFLVEVDWPGGNLLREYTVLLDPPVFTTEESGEDAGADSPSTATGSQAAGVPGEIEREGEQEAAGEAPERQAAAKPADDQAAEDSARERAAAEEPAAADGDGARADAARRSGDFDDTPVFLQVEREDEEADRRAEQEAAERKAERERREREATAEARAQGYEPTQAGETGSGAGAGAAEPEDERAREYGPVKSGDTLWQIASRLRTGDVTVQQMMLALLRYNPEAFAGDNINRLREGYVLRVPEREEVARISAQQAVARVGEQNALWEEWRRAQAGQTTRQAQREAGATGEGGQAAAGSDGEARLEIVGSAEGGASSDEEASATSSGEQDASQQLQTLREQLESARMEKSELQSRVAELEQTVDKMEQLITLRENKLSELQDQLEALKEQRGENQQAVAEAPDEGEEGEAAAAADGGGDGGSGDTSSADAGEATGDGATQTASADDGAASGEEASAAADDAEADADGAATGEDGGAGDGSTTGSTTQTADASGAGEDTGTTTSGSDGGTSADAGADDAEAASGDGSGGSEQAAAGDADGESAADSGVVTTRTQPPEQSWLDIIVGFFAGIGAAVGGVLAGSGLFGGPLSPGVLGIGLVVILVLGWLLVRQRRAAAESEGDESAPVFAEGEEEDTPWGDVDLGQMDDSEGMVTEEFAGTGASGGSDAEEAESALMAERFDLDDLDGGDETLPAGGEEDEDEGAKDDTIAEADVYLAYGLHQQAEDLLRLALKESPQRADYQEKLLETLYAAGNRDDFVTEAHAFQGMVDSDKSRPWQRVLAMGQELAPDDALFAGASAAEVDRSSLQPSKPSSTDFELDAEGGAVDFGFDDDESGSDSGGSQGASADDTMMLDAGELEKYDQDEGLAGPSGSGTSQQGGASGSEEAEELEFDLGDLEDFGGQEETASSGSTESSEEGELEFDLSDFDEPVSETPPSEATQTATGEPAGTEAGTEATQAGGSSGEDEFDFDLSDFDAGGGEGPGEDTADSGAGEDELDATEAATGTPDFDLDSELESASFEDTDESTGSPSEATTPGQGGDDLELDLGDLDFGDEEQTATSDGSATGDDGAGSELEDPDAVESAAGTSGDDAGDFDLEGLEGPETSASSGSDLDSEFAGDDAAGGDQTQQGGGGVSSETSESAGGLDFDLDLDDLGSEGPEEDTLTSGAADTEATEAGQTADSGSSDMEANADDEFDTMLDLAKAYIDMGDRESAGNALEEVIESGSESQRREARELLESVS